MQVQIHVVLFRQVPEVQTDNTRATLPVTNRRTDEPSARNSTHYNERRFLQISVYYVIRATRRNSPDRRAYE